MTEVATSKKDNKNQRRFSDEQIKLLELNKQRASYNNLASKLETLNKDKQAILIQVT